MLTEQQLALVDALERHKLLVCVGPLVSMAVGLPGPLDLVELCRQRLAEHGHAGADLSGSLAQALEQAERLLGSAPFVHLVRAAWEPATPVPVPASARALVGMSPGLNAIVTTNLDRLLERAFEGRWHTVEEVVPDMAKRTRAIFKIRGTIGQSTTWVLTARQQVNDSLFEILRRRELAALLRSHVVLFVGFAPDDEAFAYLLDVRGHPVADERRRATETSHPDVALVPVSARRVQPELGDRGVEQVPLAGEYDAAVATYLRALADELGRRTRRVAPTVAAEVEAAEPIVENPYPGLRPFTADNRRYFFGREDDLSRMVALLRQTGATSHPWLLIDGPSGVGKSSLLQAGLSPAMERGEVQLPAATRAWRTVTMRPGPAPVVELANRLHRVLVGDGPCELTASALGAAVRHRAAALGEFVAAHLPAGDGLVLLVDQLEEALLVPDTGAREAFAAALAEMLVRSPRPLLLITALRSDFSGDLPRLPALHERMTSTSPPVRYTLATLTSAQLTAAIERPADEARVELEEGLTERVLADAGHIERGAGEDATPETALPLVAAAMTSLYDRRAGRRLTHASYDALGGVAGALTGRADETLAPLREKITEAQLWAFFRQFVETDAQGRTTRRSALRTEALAALDGAVAEDLLARLTGNARSMRLVIVRGEGDGRRIDLIHDALLRNWTWLRDHIDRDRAELLRESELGQAAARWDRFGRPRDGLPSGAEAEYFLRAITVPGSLSRTYQDALRAHMRRRRRALRAVLAALASGVLTLTGVSAYAWQQRNEALAKTQLAEERLGTANILVENILFEALPKLEQVAGTAIVQKEIHSYLDDLQRTLLADASSNAWWLRNRMVQHRTRGGLALTHDDLALARHEFKAGLAIAERLLSRNPTSVEAERDLSVSVDRLGDVEIKAGNLAAARRHYDRALKIREALEAADPTSAQAQRDLSVSLDKLGDVEVKAGNLEPARSHYDRALKVREMLAASDPASPQAQRDFSISLEKLGDVEVQAGNLSTARQHFQRTFEVRDALATADPTSAQAQRDLSIALDNLGDVEMQAGNLVAARRHYGRSLTEREALAGADPISAQAQRDLSVSLTKLGDVEVQAGNLSAARRYYDRSLKVAEALAAADPISAQAKRDLSISLERLGDMDVQAGNLAAARGHYERSRAVREVLAAADSISAQGKRDLSISLSKLGDVEVQAGNLAAARGYYERSLKVAEDLAVADPTSAQVQRDVSISLNKLGDVEVKAGNLAVARGHYDRALKMREVLASADATSALSQRDLYVSLNNLGDVEVQAGNLGAARTHYDRALAVSEALAAANPTSALAQRDLSISLKKLGDAEVQAGNLAAARGHYERVLKLSEALAAADATSAQAKRDISVTLHNLGDVEMQAGNLAAARAHFERDMHIAETLATTEPTSAQAQRDLSVSLSNLGELEVQAGNLVAARAHFERDLRIAEALATGDPADAQGAFDVVLSHARLAELAALEGHAASSRKHLQTALTLLAEMDRRGQLAGFAEREQLQRDLQNMQADLGASPKPRK